MTATKPRPTTQSARLADDEMRSPAVGDNLMRCFQLFKLSYGPPLIYPMVAGPPWAG
jgi:hypothetical protein